MCRHILFLCGMICLTLARGELFLFVSEYGTGDLRVFDPVTAGEIPSQDLPGYQPVDTGGADGMVLGPDSRLYVNTGSGRIYSRSPDGNGFTLHVDLEVPYLLDLTRNDTHLFAAQYGVNTLYQVSLAEPVTVTEITGPVDATRFDGVRIGPDGRLYAVDSSNGSIYAYDLSAGTWSAFLNNTLAGDASQIEFGADGRVFLSRTIGNQARIHAYMLHIHRLTP